MKILLLGGTTEASALARLVAVRGDLDVTLSLAGRTRTPAAAPVPMRVGGFGEAEGLAAYIAQESVALLIDATHPFAARISANAAEAAKRAGVPLLALRRPEWRRQRGDDWIEVADTAGAVAALGGPARRVLLAIGRQGAGAFAGQPQHQYWVRSIDPIGDGLAGCLVTPLLDRGPFTEAGERDLLGRHRIELMVTKNAGGEATYAKIVAARALRVPVVMIARPPAPQVPTVETAEAAIDWIDAHRGASHLRGV